MTTIDTTTELPAEGFSEATMTMRQANVMIREVLGTLEDLAELFGPGGVFHPTRTPAEIMTIYARGSSNERRRIMKSGIEAEHEARKLVGEKTRQCADALALALDWLNGETPETDEPDPAEPEPATA